MLTRRLLHQERSGPSRSGHRAAQGSINLNHVNGIANDVRKTLLLMTDRDFLVYRFFLGYWGP